MIRPGEKMGGLTRRKDDHSFLCLIDNGDLSFGADCNPNRVGEFVLAKLGQPSAIEVDFLNSVVAAINNINDAAGIARNRPRPHEASRSMAGHRLIYLIRRSPNLD